MSGLDNIKSNNTHSKPQRVRSVRRALTSAQADINNLESVLNSQLDGICKEVKSKYKKFTQAGMCSDLEDMHDHTLSCMTDPVDDTWPDDGDVYPMTPPQMLHFNRYSDGTEMNNMFQRLYRERLNIGLAYIKRVQAMILAHNQRVVNVVVQYMTEVVPSGFNALGQNDRVWSQGTATEPAGYRPSVHVAKVADIVERSTAESARRRGATVTTTLRGLLAQDMRMIDGMYAQMGMPSELSPPPPPPPAQANNTHTKCSKST